jgi:predicted lipid-binding transport protein (Tim44 family)
MAKYKIFELIHRHGKTKKLKTQFELSSMNENIEKIRKLETDLTFNIAETVELGVVQTSHRALINSKLREKMINQKEIVGNKIEFLMTEKIHLQKLVSSHERKNRKILEKLNELNVEERREKELKEFQRDILFQKK